MQIAQAGFGAALARAEAENALRADDVAAVEALRRDIERRRRDLGAARTSAREQTAAAGILERVGYALPEGTWLTRVAVDSVGVEIAGITLDPARVAEVLGALEADPVITSPSLVRTLRLDPETSPDVSRPVTTFELRGSIGERTSGRAP